MKKLVKELKIEREMIIAKANKKYLRYLILKIKLWDFLMLCHQ